MSVFDKITSDQNEPSKPVFSRAKTSNIFYNFKDGDNIVRLVGEYLKVKTHRIAPANFPNWKDAGLCKALAFQRGEDRLPDTVVCSDLDVDNELPTKEKTCPICRLNEIARQFINESQTELDKAGKDFLFGVIQRTTSRVQYKWNIIDRENPEITQTVEGESKQVLGYKVSSLGVGAFEDVKGIFKQVKFDISDPEKGIDINIIKARTPRSDGKTQVSYSAQVVLDGSTLKVTPLTDEEKAMELHDLKRLAGKQIASELIVSNFHEDLRELFGSVVEGGDVAAPVVEQPEPTVSQEAPKQEAPKQEAPAESQSGWECFGTYDGEHDECKECDSAKKCEEKAKTNKAPVSQ